MSSFFIVALAIFIDRLLGEPVRYKPLQGFAKIATFIEQSWLGQEELMISKGSKGNQMIEALVKLKGTLAVLFLILPFLAVVIYLDKLALINIIFDVCVLYLAIGAHSLKQHALDVQKALAENNVEQAKKELAAMANNNTSDMSQQNILVACLQSVLKNGNNTVLAPIFWFVILGAPGAVLYRLVDMLAVMWNCQNSRYRNFGQTANRLDIILSFVPACLTAFSYILLGELKSGWRYLLQQGRAWGPAIAAGVGALNIEISSPQLTDISRACSLIERSMILWLAVIFMLGLSHC